MPCEAVCVGIRACLGISLALGSGASSAHSRQEAQVLLWSIPLYQAFYTDVWFATQEKKPRHKGEGRPMLGTLESYFLSLLRVFVLLEKPCKPATILPETLTPFISLASISVHLNVPFKVQEVAGRNGGADRRSQS